MRSPAARTTTFLLTDIQGSTRLWDVDRESMAVSLAAHDRILRSVVEDAGGTIVKGTGDGLLAAFDRPEWAINAAVEGQRALDRHDWPSTGPLLVRMAIHSGAVEARDGDLFGPPLNRVARLLAIGHGRQILVSGVTAAMIADTLTSTVTLLDLGEHRLRDLDRPEHVFQLFAPGLARDFPALRSGAERRSNLPSQVTSFVGRERELAEVARLLGSSRLVTLVGVGGTGKTRLMLQAAGQDTKRHSDGIWLVELAPISDPSLVIPEVARAIGIPQQPGRPPLTTIIDFLRSKDLLLLIDNCEHLIAVVADLADALLGTCPKLTILATSREPLSIPGETIFAVPSLALPDSIGGHRMNDHMDAAQLAAAGTSEAVRLFIDRATATVPDLVLDPGTVAAIVEICRRLDGIPLAIELAAARVNVLSVAEIGRGLDDRFRLLTGGPRTAVPRQRTLQALIDWSWDLLSESDRRLLRRLSVFSGGWTLEAASDVTPETPTNSTEIRLATLDGLSRLVDRSMIVAEHRATTRYRMLETIRQYAGDRLVAADEANAYRTRHLEHYRDLTVEAAASLRGPEEVRWLHRLDMDVDNLRAGLEWAHQSDPGSALLMTVSMIDYWRTRSVGSEAIDRLTTAVEMAERLPEPAPNDRAEHDRLAARVLFGATMAAYVWGDHRASRAWGDRAVTLAQSSGDPVALMDALMARMFQMIMSGGSQDPSGIGAEVVAHGEPLGEWSRVAFAETAVAMYHAPRDAAAAEDWLERAVEAARRSGHPSAIAFAALARGRAAGYRREIDVARRWFTEASDLYAEIGDRRLQLVARSDLAYMLRRSGALVESAVEYRATILEWRFIGNRGAVANQLENIGFLAVAARDGPRAARLLGAAEAQREVDGAGMQANERAEYEVEVANLHEILDTTAFALAWTDGRLLSIDAAVALAVTDSGAD